MDLGNLSARGHDPKRVRKSAHMHVRWGAMRSRVVVDAIDHLVLDGHHRLAVARRLGSDVFRCSSWTLPS